MSDTGIFQTTRDARPPGRVGVVGAGLIGGSVLLRAHSLGHATLALDQDTAVQATAAELGLELAQDLDELAARCQIIVIAVPPSRTAEVWAQIADRAKGRTQRVVVVDVASTKRQIAQRVEASGGFAASDAVLALTHPMAGREHSGLAAADDRLFIDRTWLVTPHEGMRASELSRILDFVSTMGAHTTFMDIDSHERFTALASHMPHLLSFCYRQMLDDLDPAGTWRFAGGSLSDLLRVADADVALWQEILRDNADEVARVKDDLVRRLNQGWTPRESDHADPGLPDAADVSLSLDEQLHPAEVAAMVAAGTSGLRVTRHDHDGNTLRLRLERSTA